MHEIFASDSALHSFIVDSEIVAVDPVDGTLKTFQELSNRARKDVQINDVKVAVGIFAFDLMYLNGEVRSSMWTLFFVLIAVLRFFSSNHSASVETS